MTDQMKRTFEINGYRMAYVGEGRGEPLVICARSLSDYRYWARQARPRRTIDVLGFNIFFTDLAIMGLKISSVYLFVAVDPNGDESVPAFSDGDVFMPLMGTDPARVDDCARSQSR